MLKKMSFYLHIVCQIYYFCLDSKNYPYSNINWVFKIEPQDRNLTALTICFRAQLKFWNETSLFDSEKISIFLLDFNMLGGYIQIGGIYFHFRFSFN